MRFPRIFLAALSAAIVTVAAAQTPTLSPTPDAPAPAAMPVPPPPVPTGAKAWLLMDYDTGQILAGENIDLRLEPASITKVMTSYVAAAEAKNGKIKPDDLVTVSERAWREGGAGTDGSYSGFAFVRHGVTLERDFAPVPFVSVDKHKVLQVLTNLLRNAKYAVDDTTAQKKLIRIGTRIEGKGFVAITVTDNGVGIAPENLTRIFAHGFTTRKEGHGFGLHSGALAAKEMGGALTAHSDGPGHGATFTITVPIAYDLTVATTTHACPPKTQALTAAS